MVAATLVKSRLITNALAVLQFADLSWSIFVETDFLMLMSNVTTEIPSLMMAARVLV